MTQYDKCQCVEVPKYDKGKNFDGIFEVGKTYQYYWVEGYERFFVLCGKEDQPISKFSRNFFFKFFKPL